MSWKRNRCGMPDAIEGFLNQLVETETTPDRSK